MPSSRWLFHVTIAFFPWLFHVTIEHEPIASVFIKNQWQRCFPCRIYIVSSLTNRIKFIKITFQIRNFRSFHLSSCWSNFTIYIVEKSQKWFTPIRRHVNQAFKRFNMDLMEVADFFNLRRNEMILSDELWSEIKA